MRCTLSVTLVLLLIGMFAPRVRAQGLSEPEKNFEELWKAFDQNYSHFGVKNIDWNALYRVYRPRVTAKTTDDELFDVMSAMIGHLNDNHVGLRSPSRRFGAGVLQELKMEDFSLDLVKAEYLHGKATPLRDGVFTYGWVRDSIGYFHLGRFGDVAASSAAVDAILKEFRT